MYLNLSLKPLILPNLQSARLLTFQSYRLILNLLFDIRDDLRFSLHIDSLEVLRSVYHDQLHDCGLHERRTRQISSVRGRLMRLPNFKIGRNKITLGIKDRIYFNFISCHAELISPRLTRFQHLPCSISFCLIKSIVVCRLGSVAERVFCKH